VLDVISMMSSPFYEDREKTLELVVRKSPDAISTNLEGESVILHVTTGEYCGLNNVGTFLWERMEGKQTVGSLVKAVLLKYEVNEEECLQDVLAFVETLIVHDLILLK
jgi:hypothetical protein